MARILCITLNPALDLTVSLDRLQLGMVNRCTGLDRHAAGKGINVAQVLADLGHKLTVSGFLGVANAAPFEALFHKRGFVDAFIRVPGETRSNIKLSESTGRITDLNGLGPQVDAAARDELLERIDSLVGCHDAVVVAGSLPRGVDTEWFGAFLRRLSGHGVRLVLDSSDEALRVGLAVKPWLVKPNEEELVAACGLADTTLDQVRMAAQRLRDAGVANVLLSHGAEGVSWYGEGIELAARPPQVNVVSTVGAGDSLLAATLHGLLEGHTAEDTVRHATAIAAQAVTRIGFGIHDRAGLTRLEANVVVTPLSERSAQ